MASIEFDHVGVVVHDLEATAQFFVDLGFHREGPIEVSGACVDRIVGLEGVRAELIMVTAPDGSGKLELTAFHEPTRAQDQTELPATAHGYRHIGYRVSGIGHRRSRGAGPRGGVQHSRRRGGLSGLLPTRRHTGQISPHSLRHTFATIALDSGTSLHALQDSMGHADPRTTRRYDRARNNLLKSAGYDVARALA